MLHGGHHCGPYCIPDLDWKICQDADGDGRAGDGFGGLTLYLQDETFIKIKPTVIYCLFAAILLGGLAVNRIFLQTVLGEVFALSGTGWRLLTYRWAGFFIFLALLNEAVWRSVSTDAWVSFKVFGLVPLVFIFAAMQAGFLQRHAKSAK